MTEPTSHDSSSAGDRAGSAQDRTGEARPDESRDISDVGLPGPGDEPDLRGEDATGGVAAPDEAALDEVFPAEDR